MYKRQDLTYESVFFPVENHLSVIPPTISRGLRFVFDADDGTHGRELWVSDGTASGTLMVGDIETGDGIDYTSEITEWMNGVVFTTNGGQGQRMWWTNGSITTSIWQAPWLTSSASSDLMNQSSSLSSLGQNMLLGDENRLWFAAKEANIGLEVMQLDSDGTMTMYDLHPFGDSSPSEALVSNNGLVLVAGDGTGRQLAHLDGAGGVQWTQLRLATGMEVAWVEGSVLAAEKGWGLPDGAAEHEVDCPAYGRLGLSGDVVCEIP